jgi:hypothetical protein
MRSRTSAPPNDSDIFTPKTTEGLGHPDLAETVRFKGSGQGTSADRYARADCRLPGTGAMQLEGGIGVLDTRRNLVRSMFLDAVADDSDETL